MPLKLPAVSILALALVACGGGEKEETPAPAETPAASDEEVTSDPAPTGDEQMEETSGPSLEEVLANTALRGEAGARDKFRHPAETLAFFGLEPGMTVVEISPGGGWYTDILAPYVGLGGGKLIAANSNPASSERAAASVEAFTAKYASGDFGKVEVTVFAPGDFKIAEDGSADMVLTFRNVHNWVGSGFDKEAFGKFYAALKPGGVLGVVEHRLPEDREGNTGGGYVKESYVISLAEGAGFTLDGQSEVNANPLDTADHPFGVWTLPPVSRTPREGEEVPEGFDPAAFLAIGESDRMTLRFVKPAE